MIPDIREEDQVIVEDGMIYLPASYDSSVKAELESDAEAKFESLETLEKVANPEIYVEEDGDHFLPAVSVESVVEGYETLEPVRYRVIRDNVVQQIENEMDFDQEAVNIDENLETIVFEVMPYFMNLSGYGEEDKDVIEKIIEEVDEDLEDYYARVDSLRNMERLEEKARSIKESAEEYCEMPEGRVSGERLVEILEDRVSSRIVRDEAERLLEAERRKNALDESRDKLALMYLLKDTDGFEVENAGFEVRGSEYVIYAQTGDFALMDRDGELYHFPNAKVGVTTKDLHPQVLNKYKHPFLKSHSSEQHICKQNLTVPRGKFTAEKAIEAIDDAVEMLKHGYMVTGSGHFGFNALNGDNRGDTDYGIRFGDWSITEEEAERMGLEVTNKHGMPG